MSFVRFFKYIGTNLFLFLFEHPNLQLLKLDSNDGAMEYPEVDTDALEMLEPIEPAVRKRKHQPQYSARAESVSSLASLESAAGDVDKVSLDYFSENV